MGREAVNLILDQIDHMELAQNKKEVIEERSPAQILLKPELIVRATT